MCNFITTKLCPLACVRIFERSTSRYRSDFCSGSSTTVPLSQGRLSIYSTDNNHVYSFYVDEFMTKF